MVAMLAMLAMMALMAMMAMFADGHDVRFLTHAAVGVPP